MTILVLFIMFTLCALVFYRIGHHVGWRQGWDTVLNFISEGEEDPTP
jgi:hypothetical protein